MSYFAFIHFVLYKNMFQSDFEIVKNHFYHIQNHPKTYF